MFGLSSPSLSISIKSLFLGSFRFFLANLKQRYLHYRLEGYLEEGGAPSGPVLAMTIARAEGEAGVTRGKNLASHLLELLGVSGVSFGYTLGETGSIWDPSIAADAVGGGGGHGDSGLST